MLRDILYSRCDCEPFQVQMMQRFSVVAGINGAGLMNCLYLPANSVCIQVCNQRCRSHELSVYQQTVSVFRYVINGAGLMNCLYLPANSVCIQVCNQWCRPHELSVYQQTVSVSRYVINGAGLMNCLYLPANSVCIQVCNQRCRAHELSVSTSKQCLYSGM